MKRLRLFLVIVFALFSTAIWAQYHGYYYLRGSASNNIGSNPILIDFSYDGNVYDCYYSYLNTNEPPVKMEGKKIKGGFSFWGYDNQGTYFTITVKVVAKKKYSGQLRVGNIVMNVNLTNER